MEASVGGTLRRDERGRGDRPPSGAIGEQDPDPDQEVDRGDGSDGEAEAVKNFRLVAKLWLATIAIYFWPWIPLLIFRAQLSGNPYAFGVLDLLHHSRRSEGDEALRTPRPRRGIEEDQRGFEEVTKLGYGRKIKLDTDDWIRLPRDILELLQIPEGAELLLTVHRQGGKSKISLEPYPEGFE